MDKYIKSLSQGQNLSRGQAYEAVSLLIDGDFEPEQAKEFLILLSEKSETSDEIAGAASALREKALVIDAPDDCVDCCGTGGDGSHSYNISTASAFVCAAAGVPTAKHGNRSASSRCGAADVLESLGVNLEMPVEMLQSSLHKLNFCFLMAPKHHSAMKNVAPIRKEIGKRTIFNLLGPLANPANSKTQLIGVFDRKFILPLAYALKSLGSQKAWVVHGSDGLDEITLCGTTYVAELKDGNITEFELTSKDFGLNQINAEDIKGGDPQENARALRRLLEGEKSAYRNIVIANAASVIYLHRGNVTLSEAVKIAQEAIDSGKALEILELYISIGKQQ